MATSRKKQLWYLWIARDERQQHPKYHDELELHGSLHVFYDSPILKKWQMDIGKTIRRRDTVLYVS